MKDRIKAIMDHLHLTQQIFSMQTGINAATLSGILTGKTNPSTNVLTYILRRYPQFNPTWLLLGTGDMLLATSTGSATAHQPQGASAAQPMSQSTGQNTTSQQQLPGNESGTVIQGTSGNDSATPTTAKVAATSVGQPGLFDVPNVAQQPMPTTPSRGTRSAAPNREVRANNQSDVRASAAVQAQQSLNSTAAIQVMSQPMQPIGRKITEIRVFYDDQTFESFVPKK